MAFLMASVRGLTTTEMIQLHFPGGMNQCLDILVKDLFNLINIKI